MGDFSGRSTRAGRVIKAASQSRDLSGMDELWRGVVGVVEQRGMV